MKPDTTTIDVFCEMSTDNGGWTLVMYDAVDTGTNTAPPVRGQSNNLYFDTTMYQKPASGAKFSSADMLKYANNKEFLIRNNINDTYIIKYSNDIATNGIDFRGMTNWVYQSKQSNGTFTTCNGHVNNRGISTYSDSIGDVCLNYSGNKFYYNSWHIRCETGLGASDSGYCNSGTPNRPISIFIR